MELLLAGEGPPITGAGVRRQRTMPSMMKARRGRPHGPPSQAPAPESPVVGIALGSGAARGWAHIGVLQALGELGIQPQIVCGASMGALVGAAYVCGHLDALGAWAGGLRRRGYLRFLDIHMPGRGLVQGGRLMEFLARYIEDVAIAELPKPFATVATDLATGREVWLREGRVLDAVRASIAVPGLFTPMQQGRRWLVDGGLVNPVPVSLCRALGAQVVIGVNPFGDRMARFSGRNALQGTPLVSALEPDDEPGVSAVAGAPNERRRRRLRLRRRTEEPERPDRGPGMLEVMMGALNIMQDRITRSRMAGDPPDVLLAPRIAHITLLEFDRAAEAIAEGRACVQRMLPALQDVVGL
jgi:NTE family protein